MVDEIVNPRLMEIQPRIGAYVTVYNGPAGCQKAGFTNDEATGKNHAHQETLRVTAAQRSIKTILWDCVPVVDL